MIVLDRLRAAKRNREGRRCINAGERDPTKISAVLWRHYVVSIAWLRVLKHRIVLESWSVTALAVIVSWLVVAPAVLAGEEYSFAVVPQFDQRKLFATWKPILDELEKRTGLRFRLVVTLSIPEFEPELSKGAFDFVYTNPYQIMREAPRQGYVPLVRDADPLHGILVVPKTSPISKVEELDGKVLAVPSANSIGASLLIRADLERLHHVKMRMLNAKTHTSAYLHVVNGLVDAGGGIEKTLAGQTPAIRDALRILYTTRDVPSHPVSAHPRVPVEVRNKVRAALLDLAATPGGAAMLADVPMPHMVPAAINDYLPMSGWGLEAFWIEGAQ